jgi:uncharacterized membrane protein
MKRTTRRLSEVAKGGLLFGYWLLVALLPASLYYQFRTLELLLSIFLTVFSLMVVTAKLGLIRLLFVPLLVTIARCWPNSNSQVDFTLWYPVIVNVILALVFCGSLLSKKSIILRVAERWETSELTDYQTSARARYCLMVTICWAVFFFLNAVIVAYLAGRNLRFSWFVFVGFLSYLLVGVGLLGEYVIRIRFRRSIGITTLVAATMGTCLGSANLQASDDILNSIDIKPTAQSVQKLVRQKRYSSGLARPHESTGVVWFESKGVVGDSNDKDGAIGTWRFGWKISGEGGESIHRSSSSIAAQNATPEQQLGEVLSAFFAGDKETLQRLFSVRKDFGDELVFTPKSFRLKRAIKGIRIDHLPEPNKISVLLGAEERIEISLLACDQSCEAAVAEHQAQSIADSQNHHEQQSQ